MSFSSSSTSTIILEGFLGKDPIERFTRARTRTRKVPHPGGDVVVEEPIPARPYWKLSLGVPWERGTEWHDCIVWNPTRREVRSADLSRKGDRVVLTGYHESYTFTQEGKTVSGRRFVVESFRRVG